MRTTFSGMPSAYPVRTEPLPACAIRCMDCKVIIHEGTLPASDSLCKVCFDLRHDELDRIYGVVTR